MPASRRGMQRRRHGMGLTWRDHHLCVHWCVGVGRGVPTLPFIEGFFSLPRLCVCVCRRAQARGAADAAMQLTGDELLTIPLNSSQFLPTHFAAGPQARGAPAARRARGHRVRLRGPHQLCGEFLVLGCPGRFGIECVLCAVLCLGAGPCPCSSVCDDEDRINFSVGLCGSQTALADLEQSACCTVFGGGAVSWQRCVRVRGPH